MIKFKHRHRKQIPMLNTASLPDLIFTVLFFFMIVTHMRKVTLKVKYQTPQGTELTRLVKKSAVTYLFVGKNNGNSDSISIQVNDKITSLAMLEDYIIAERSGMSSEDREQMVVAIKADHGVPMGLISDVKQALRRAKVYHISYIGEEKELKRQDF